LREEKFPPVLCERSESGVFQRHLLNDFVAQQATESRADLGELLCVLRRTGLPSEENIDDRGQSRRRCELGARLFDIAFEVDDLADQFAVAPQAEGIAICVE